MVHTILLLDLAWSTRSTTGPVGQTWAAAGAAAWSARSTARATPAATARTTSRLTHRILICRKAGQGTASATGSTRTNRARWAGSARLVVDRAIGVAAILARRRNINRLRLGLAQYRLADLARLADPLRIAHHIGIGYQRWIVDHTGLAHHLRYPHKLWHLDHPRRVHHLWYRYLSATIHHHRFRHDLLGEDDALLADQTWRLLHGDAFWERWRYSWRTLWYCL